MTADGVTLSQKDVAGIVFSATRCYTASGMVLTQSNETGRDLLTGLLYKRGATTVSRRTYTYDALGRPLTRSTLRTGATVNDTFAYNNRSELTAATVNNEAYAYDYDNVGNRKTARAAAEEITGYQANALNQYTAISVDDITDFAPEYDAAGNQCRVKTSTGIWAVSYDSENRPTDFTSQAADGTITTVHCEYDYMGRRTTKVVTVDNNVTLQQRYIYRGYLQMACIDLTRSHHPALWYITWDPTQQTATRPLAIQKDGTWFHFLKNILFLHKALFSSAFFSYLCIFAKDFYPSACIFAKDFYPSACIFAKDFYPSACIFAKEFYKKRHGSDLTKELPCRGVQALPVI